MVTCAPGRMARTRSRWSETPARGGRAGLLCLAALALVGAPAAAQDDEAGARCRLFDWEPLRSECHLAVGAARIAQPRLAAALFGGNAVPGTASTLGMRLGTLPRMSLALRVTSAPAELAPIADRSDSDGSRALLFGFGADAAVGVLTGFSPLPTVGGVLSLDVIGRVAYVPLSRSDGFQDGGVFGWALGARVGALRESFTLPGVALTGLYGRIARTGLGDPNAADTRGFFEGAMTDWHADLAASKRVGLVGLTGGIAYDRYGSDLLFGFSDSAGGRVVVVERAEAIHDRWSAYLNAGWTMLIFQASAELGWQEAPLPPGLPPDVDLDPVGWFGGVTFRISI